MRRRHRVILFAIMPACFQAALCVWYQVGADVDSSGERPTIPADAAGNADLSIVPGVVNLGTIPVGSTHRFSIVV